MLSKYQKRLVGFTVFWVAFWFTVLFTVALFSEPARAASLDADWNIVPPKELVIPVVDKCVIGGEELLLLRQQMKDHAQYTYKIGGWYSQYSFWDHKSSDESRKEFCRVYGSLYKAMK